MDPTRLDSKRSPTVQSLRTNGSAQGRTPAVTGEVATAGKGASAVVETRGGGLAETARSETQRLDRSRLDELSARIESGNYHVDADALAERILDDALGPEVSG